MASSFESEFATAASELMSEFGRSATYTPPKSGASAVSSIQVRVTQPRKNSAFGDDNVERDVWTAVLIVLQSAVAIPEKHGRFFVDSRENWTVSADPILKNGEWLCECERSGREVIGEKRVQRQS